MFNSLDLVLVVCNVIHHSMDLTVDSVNICEEPVVQSVRFDSPRKCQLPVRLLGVHESCLGLRHGACDRLELEILVIVGLLGTGRPSLDWELQRLDGRS